MVKKPPAKVEDVRDAGLIHGLGRSPGEGHGNLLQHCCLKSSLDRGAWKATVHGIAQSWTRLKRLSLQVCATPDVCVFVFFFLIYKRYIPFIFLILGGHEACEILVPQPEMERCIGSTES